jgi:hypothetical protein
LLRILDAVSDLAPEVLVPGHGPIGSRDSLTVMGQYVRIVDGLAGKMIEGEAAEETVGAVAVPEPFDDWLFSSFFPGNVEYLHQRRLREQRDAAA